MTAGAAAEGAGEQMFAPFDNCFFPPARGGLGSVNLFFFSPARSASRDLVDLVDLPLARGQPRLILNS